MNKKKYIGLIGSMFPILVCLFLVTPAIYGEEGMVYGHISYMENDAYVLKPGEEKALKGMVNLPLVPGDILYTEDKGRVEIQFDNGTIIRLDKNSALKIDTVLSKSLTSRNAITTLQLTRGQIYSKNQVYKKEIFQVITPHAAVNMLTRSTNLIRVTDKGQTQIVVSRGKVGVLAGKEKNSLKTQYLGAGKGVLIGADFTLKPNNQVKDKDFGLWNEKIDADFKELHYGISQVPAVIYRYSPGIVHFAEKWSSRLGTWVYDELFGYVWKPALETFDGRRPFWDANYVKINGELVLVPNQRWGWAPAHLGTWSWSKTDGWLWIPGNAFSRGICAVGLVPMSTDQRYEAFLAGGPYEYDFDTVYRWIYRVFGNAELYRLYRQNGREKWSEAYKGRFGSAPRAIKESLQNVPANVRDIIQIMDRVPIEKVSRYLGFNPPQSRFQVEVSRLARPVDVAAHRSSFLKEQAAANRSGLIAISRDWNPDSRWAGRVGVNIFYSSKTNSVHCPDLQISSNRISDLQRAMLRLSVVNPAYLRSISAPGPAGFNGPATGINSPTGSPLNMPGSPGKGSSPSQGGTGNSGQGEKK